MLAGVRALAEQQPVDEDYSKFRYEQTGDNYVTLSQLWLDYNSVHFDDD